MTKALLLSPLTLNLLSIFFTGTLSYSAPPATPAGFSLTDDEKAFQKLVEDEYLGKEWKFGLKFGAERRKHKDWKSQAQDRCSKHESKFREGLGLGMSGSYYDPLRIYPRRGGTDGFIFKLKDYEERTACTHLLPKGFKTIPNCPSFWRTPAPTEAEAREAAPEVATEVQSEARRASAAHTENPSFCCCAEGYAAGSLNLAIELRSGRAGEYDTKEHAAIKCQTQYLDGKKSASLFCREEQARRKKKGEALKPCTMIEQAQRMKGCWYLGFEDGMTECSEAVFSDFEACQPAEEALTGTTGKVIKAVDAPSDNSDSSGSKDATSPATQAR